MRINEKENRAAVFMFFYLYLDVATSGAYKM